MQESGVNNPDGWGAVFYEKNDAYVFREPRVLSDSHLAKLLMQGGIESNLVVSHIRRATSGCAELRNTHPFTREVFGRLHSFAFNGNIPGVFELDLIMDRFSPLGETDGEYAFCWLLERISGLVDNSDWEQKTDILKMFGDQLAQMGPANFLYSDSLRLYAFASRRSHSDGIRSPGLYYNKRHCKQAQNAMPWTGLSIQSSADQEQELNVIASVPLSENDWIPFEENQLMVFEKGELIGARV